MGVAGKGRGRARVRKTTGEEKKGKKIGREGWGEDWEKGR